MAGGAWGAPYASVCPVIVVSTYRGQEIVVFSSRAYICLRQAVQLFDGQFNRFATLIRANIQSCLPGVVRDSAVCLGLEMTMILWAIATA